MCVLVYLYLCVTTFLFLFLFFICDLEWWRQRWSRYECRSGMAKRIYRKRGGSIYIR